MQPAIRTQLNQFLLLLFAFTVCILSLLQAKTFAQTQNDSLAGKVNGVWWINNNALGDVSAFARMLPDELAAANTTVADIKEAILPQ